jgi:hypothetical protein
MQNKENGNEKQIETPRLTKTIRRVNIVAPNRKEREKNYQATHENLKHKTKKPNLFFFSSQKHLTYKLM